MGSPDTASDRRYVRPLDGTGASVGEVGGKAASLDRLVGAGFPVPAAVVLTAAAHRAAVNRWVDRVGELLGGSVGEAPHLLVAIRLSRATMRKIRQNLFWAAYNTAAIPVAALRSSTRSSPQPLMALSSLSVVSNAALLKRVRLRSLGQ